MAIEGVFMRLVTVLFLLETVADIMRPEGRNSDGFTLRGIKRNDFTMLRNDQPKDVPSDREEISSKESISYSSLPISKKENLEESRINEEFEEFQSLALRKDISEPKSRPRRNLNVPSSNLTSRLNNDSINLPSTAPSTPAPLTKINVTCETDHLSCKNKCTKERDLRHTNGSCFLCYCDEHCETFTDCCFDYRQHCKNDSGYLDTNTSGLVVRISQRKEKPSKILIFSSLFALKKKDNLKKHKTIGDSQKFSSLALRTGNPAHKPRTKRTVRGFGIGSGNFPGGDQSAINGISSSGSINDSVSSSSIATTTNTTTTVTTNTTATTTVTTQNTLDPTRDINVTCNIDYLSCKNRCTKERDLGQTNDSYFLCYCDEYCETFTDCCFDYRQHCKNNSVYSYLNGSWLVGNMKFNISNNESTSENYLKCISSPKGTEIWMIADCPNHFRNTPAQERCAAKSKLSYQNHKDNIPVVTRDGKTYKNRFCSLCHGVSDDELSYYALSYACRILPPRNYNSENTLAFLSSYCSISWKPKSGHQRRYCYSGKVIKICPKNATGILRKGCHNGPPGIVFSNIGYKNIYCALCYSDKSLECGPRTEPGNDASGSTVPFSLIMDLGFSGQSHSPKNLGQTQVFCPTGEVYDPHLELCRTGIASAPKQTGFDKYSVSVWVKKTTEPFKHVTATPQEVLQAFIDLSVSNIDFTSDDKTYRIMFDFVRKEKETKKQQRLPTPLSVADLLEFSQPIEVLINSKNFTIIKVTSRRLTCVAAETFLPHEYTITAHPELAAYINRTKEVIKQHDYYLGDSRNSSHGTITVCRKRLRLLCINGTYTALSTHEVTEFPNMSVLWNVGGTVYAEGSYEKQNGTIWICTNLSSNGTKEVLVEQLVENSLKIITIVGLSLSLCSLSTLLITYSIFCELRTLPGISLMNLSFCVLASHLLWLVGSGLTSETKSCTTISVALHFVFLSSFVWMSIIAIDTWRAFTKNGQRTNRMTQREKRKRYLRSMAIGWVSPLIFCLFCFTLDITNTVAIGYGGTKGCWIQNTSSNLYFFAAPMGVLLLLNAVFFVLTVKSIRETMKNSQMATGQKRGKKDLGIFVRIAALMGFTWVFGFLSSLHLYLSYVFVISCTIKGVYIAVAFLCTKRVLKLYSVLLSKGRSPPSTKVSSSSHQTGQTEQTLRSCSSFNNTHTKKKNLKARMEFHSLHILTSNGTERTNTDDTRL